MAELVLTRKPALVQRFDVGEATTVAVSRNGLDMPGAPPAGEDSVAGRGLRGRCRAGLAYAGDGGLKDCARHGCQAPQDYRQRGRRTARTAICARCSTSWSLAPQQMLVVGTRSDRVGYYDQKYSIRV